MKIALAVMRLQPLHNGHKFMIDTMLNEADRVIVGIGSVNKNDEKNPYSFELRKKMIESIYGDNVLVVPLNDIGAPNKRAWADYVLKRVKEELDLIPTIYYAGSHDDASWFAEVMDTRIVDRNIIKVSATQIRDGVLSEESIPAEVLKVIGC